MKLEKTAGRQILKMTQAEWLAIGKTAGWTDSLGEEVAKIAEKHGVEPAEIKAELVQGAKVEAEHRGVYDLVVKMLADQGCEMEMPEGEFFNRIALAHLDELPDYYARLKKMEEG